MFTVKLYRNSQLGLDSAFIREADNVEVTRDGFDYHVTLYRSGVVDGSFCLKANTAATVFVENSLGKTVQKLEALCPPVAE